MVFAVRAPRVNLLNRPRHLVALHLAAAMAWGAPATAADPAAKRSVTVLAAASLTEAFRAIGAAFETAHTGVTVQFSFAASSTLVTQITEGAPADVWRPDA